MKWAVLVASGLVSLLSAQADTMHIKAAMSAYEAGQNAARAKQYDNATVEYRRAIEIEPTFRLAFEALIETCLDAGRRSDAAATITQLLEIDPQATRYRLLLGQILLEQNQANRALAQFSFVLKVEPLNADALWWFATAANRAGMGARADAAVEQGRRAFPADKRFSKPHQQ